MVLNKVKCSNGTEIRFEETPYYYKITMGKRTWYWIKETGEFDGTSWTINKC
jgi:hypothetical protein